jgi:hypothetical protein
MDANLDTIATVVCLERDLALKRAERRAVWIDVAKETQSTKTDLRIDTATPRLGRLGRAIQSLHWALQPSHS